MARCSVVTLGTKTFTSMVSWDKELFESIVLPGRWSWKTFVGDTIEGFAQSLFRSSGRQGSFSWVELYLEDHLEMSGNSETWRERLLSCYKDIPEQYTLKQ